MHIAVPGTQTAVVQLIIGIVATNRPRTTKDLENGARTALRRIIFSWRIGSHAGPSYDTTEELLVSVGTAT